MITEDYVSFEVAKLLKEKGFQAKCTACYRSDLNYKFELVSGRINYCNPKFSKYKMIPPYNAPTLQMAMKWLREEKGFHIFVPNEIDYDEDERGDRWYHQPAYYPEIIRVSDGKIMYDDGSLYATPEQACEVAIKYCLENLI